MIIPYAYVIVCVGKVVSNFYKSTKAPRVRTSWGFLFRFGRVAYALGWLPLLVISIQPFAYVVGDYTCHNGENERSEYVSYKSTPLSLPV